MAESVACFIDIPKRCMSDITREKYACESDSRERCRCDNMSNKVV
jgi:hypothetical protein